MRPYPARSHKTLEDTEMFQLQLVRIAVAAGVLAAAVSIAVAQPTPAPTPAPAEAAPAAPAGDDAALMAVLLEEGAAVYRRDCVACHGAQGEGGAGQKLAGYAGLESKSIVAGQVIFGGQYMPAFPDLDDREVAAVATYIRNTWGNTFGLVTEAEVADVR